MGFRKAVPSGHSEPTWQLKNYFLLSSILPHLFLYPQSGSHLASLFLTKLQMEN